MARRPATLKRMDDRVEDLIDGFASYVQVFHEAQLFTGPSLYFHLRAAKDRQQHDSVSSAIHDDAFLELVYATLASWGMHRMGSGGAKLVDFSDFRDSFREQADRIQCLEQLQLTNLEQKHVDKLARYLWEIISQLEVGEGKTKIVAGTKALHHLLPDLIPPIDREYTTRFFYNLKTYTRGDEQAFYEMYPRLHRIATSCKDELTGEVGTGMSTSATKVIDNAIVGYVLRHLK
jgi:hypothetical protein